MKKRYILIPVAALLIVSFWYQRALSPMDTADRTRTKVTIEQGMSTWSIAGLLKEKELIRSQFAFFLYAKNHDGKGLQAGDFFLRPSMTAADIVLALKGGLTEEISITIPEGFTVKQIDRLLSEKELSQPGDILACAQHCDFSAFKFLPSSTELAARGGKVEGYLFPDTYFVVTDGFDAEEFLSRMLQNFQKRVVDGLKPDIASSGRSLKDIMTMASLIEEETRTNSERPVVAGILWKRLQNKVGLGVDAAVRYIIDKPIADITQSDLEVNSPYNLRKFQGLPPGPIANPGLQSIKASLHPVESPYWYYLHGTDGAIHYAQTNDEHNANRAKYLR